MKNQFVLEWSHKTNNLHIQPLEAHLSRNQERFMDNDPCTDYAVIFFGTHDAVTEMANHWRGRIHQRESLKAMADAI